MSDTNERVGGVHVMGTGTVVAVPDQAKLTFAVVTYDADDAGKAQSANATTMNAVLEVLRGHGVNKTDITTTGYRLGQRYDGRKSRYVGHEVTNSVVALVRDLETIGALLSAAVAAGTTNVNGPLFQVSDRAARLDGARDLALADARAKAERYATAGGFSLGRIVDLEEVEQGNYRHQAMGGMRMMAAGAEAAPQIEAGEEELQVAVRVVYAFA